MQTLDAILLTAHADASDVALMTVGAGERRPASGGRGVGEELTLVTGWTCG